MDWALEMLLSTTATKEKGQLKPPTASLTAYQESELFQRDLQAIAQDLVTCQWWKECEPCQDPFGNES